LRAVVPSPARRWLKQEMLRVERSRRAHRGDTDLGSLRRTTPVSRDSGQSRGQPVDRYFIEQFLAQHAADVRGHVLDFCDDCYARRFWGTRVTRVDVLHLTDGNPRATIVADLATGENIPSNTFDCIICTQVLLYVYDIHSAVKTLYRILRQGGIMLVTVPGVAHKISRAEMEQGGDYWRFTTLCLRRLFEEVFPPENIEVKAYGNVLAAITFLDGFAVQDLRRKDLDCSDPGYEVSIGLRAVKPVPVYVEGPPPQS